MCRSLDVPSPPRPSLVSPSLSSLLLRDLMPLCLPPQSESVGLCEHARSRLAPWLWWLNFRDITFGGPTDTCSRAYVGSAQKYVQLCRRSSDIPAQVALLSPILSWSRATSHVATDFSCYNAEPLHWTIWSPLPLSTEHSSAQIKLLVY